MSKLIAGLLAAAFVAGCANNSVWPEDCNTVPDKAFRDQCFAESILEAQREISAAEAAEIKEAKDAAAEEADAARAD